MPKMLQVRNIPDELHAELCRRARLRHQSLTAFVQSILEREAARPPVEELFERIRGRQRIELPVAPDELIRTEREERQANLESLPRERSRRPSRPGGGHADAARG